MTLAILGLFATVSLGSMTLVVTGLGHRIDDVIRRLDGVVSRLGAIDERLTVLEVKLGER